MQLKIHNMAGHLIRRLHQISTSVFQNGMKQHHHDCTAVQFAALHAIAKNPKGDQATIAGLIAYDRATIGGVIDRLEARELVSRSVNKRDRRAKELMLTEEGKTTLQAMMPVVEKLQADMLAGLSETEQVEFLRLAGKMATNGNHLSRAPLIFPEATDNQPNQYG
jgi:DNA-binding MarR family transcriptional regulator